MCDLASFKPRESIRQEKEILNSNAQTCKNTGSMQGLRGKTASWLHLKAEISLTVPIHSQEKQNSRKAIKLSVKERNNSHPKEIKKMVLFWSQIGLTIA